GVAAVDAVRVPQILVGHFAAERAVVDVERDRLVEPAPVRVDLRAAFLRPVVDEADARGDEVREGDGIRADRLTRDRVDRVAERLGPSEPLLLVAETGVDRQVRKDRPAVLDEAADVPGIAVDVELVEEVARLRDRSGAVAVRNEAVLRAVR